MVVIELCSSSSFEGELQLCSGEEGDQKDFSCQSAPSRLDSATYSPYLRFRPSQGRSYPAADQDGGIKAQPFCSYLRPTLTSTVLPEIPSRLPKTLWGLCWNLTSHFVVLLPPLTFTGADPYQTPCAPKCLSSSDFSQHSSESPIDREAVSLQWQSN